MEERGAEARGRRSAIEPGSEGRIHSVLLVVSRPVVLRGMEAVVADCPDLIVSDAAGTIEEALDAVVRRQPDVIVTGIALSDGSVLRLIRDMHSVGVNAPIVVLSPHDEALYAERLLRAGARGYIAMSQPCERIAEGIRDVVNGRVHLSAQIASEMLDKLVHGSSSSSGRSLDRLTLREFEIFELIGRGMQTREIAEMLHISSKTVDAHREHIKKKLKLDSAGELLAYAIQEIRCSADSMPTTD